MSKFFGALGHFFKHLAVLVSDGFIAIFGSDAAHSFAAGAEGLLHTALGQIALTAVQEVEALASGVEKRAAAFTKITDAAKSAGIAVTESVISMLIELAVQRVKGAFGPAPTV
jgi:hypothetical protein